MQIVRQSMGIGILSLSPVSVVQSHLKIIMTVIEYISTQLIGECFIFNNYYIRIDKTIKNKNIVIILKTIELTG